MANLGGSDTAADFGDVSLSGDSLTDVQGLDFGVASASIRTRGTGSDLIEFLDRSNADSNLLRLTEGGPIDAGVQLNANAGLDVSGSVTGIGHGDLGGISSGDHHSRYTDSEATSAVGGSTPWANSDLSNSSVTVAGNAVALGNSTAIAHADLSNIGTDDHHVKTTSSDIDHDTTTGGTRSDAHHAKYTDTAARSAIEAGEVSHVEGTNVHRVDFSQSIVRITDHSGKEDDLRVRAIDAAYIQGNVAESGSINNLSGSTYVQSSEPSSPSAGDWWIDTS